MGEFTDVCLGFPTVLFGGALVVVVGFWVLVLVGGADAHGPGHHGAGGGHSMGHGGAHGAAHPGMRVHGGHAAAGHGPGHSSAGGGRLPAHDGGHVSAHDAGHPSVRGSAREGAHGGARRGDAGLLAAAGLDGVPVTVVLSLLIALGWFLSLAGSAALDGAGAHGPVRAAADTVLPAAALVGAWLFTWLLVRPLRHLFPYGPPPSREDFVGRICVIRTGSVTAGFGQAEVAAPDGSTAVVQVRQSGGDTFTSGGTGLLYGYDPDGEFFWVAPFEDPAAGPPGARALP